MTGSSGRANAQNATATLHPSRQECYKCVGGGVDASGEERRHDAYCAAVRWILGRR
jgi:hypothetical protein